MITTSVRVIAALPSNNVRANPFVADFKAIVF
jgi:hypothetical protein